MDFSTKQKYDRNSSISTLNFLCDATKKDFESTLACGLALYTKGEEKRLKYKSTVETMNEGERKLQIERSQFCQLPSNEAAEVSTTQVNDSKKLESLNTSIAEVQARLTSSLTLQRLAKRQCQWAKAFLRHIYIRQAVNAAWKVFCNNKFKWLEDESLILRRIESFCTDRIKEVPENQIEYKFYKTWLEDQIKRVSIQFDALDIEQESLLEAEIRRIHRYANHANDQNHSTQELVFSYEIDEKFQLEWVGAELGALKCPEGSEDRLRFMEWCIELRKKQENIREQLQMQLQNNLTNEYEAEEAYIKRYVILSGDAAGASIEDFQLITARLVDPFQPLKHIKWETWYDMYKGQPWLSIQAEASAADRQDRVKQFQELDKMKANLTQSKANIVSLQRKIADMSHEQDLLDAAALKDGEVEKRNFQEMEDRDMKNRRLLQLKDLLEKENDILKHEMNGYEQLAETISIFKNRIEKEIQSEQIIENKRNKLMAEFQLREYSGTQGKAKSSAPIQMSKKTVKKEIKLLNEEQSRLRALHNELSGKKKGGGSRKNAAKLQQQSSSLNSGLLEKTISDTTFPEHIGGDRNEVPSGESAEVALEIERKSKIAGIERQLEDGKIALSLLKTSPTSHEASMAILRLQAEAKARIKIQQSSELKDIEVQQEKLRKGREMLVQKAAATENERLSENNAVQQNTLKDDDEMIKPEQNSSLVLPQLRQQREERAADFDVSVPSPRSVTKQFDTTKPVPAATQKVLIIRQSIT